MSLEDYSDDEIFDEYDRRVRELRHRCHLEVAEQYLTALNAYHMQQQLSEIQELPEV